MTMPKFTEKIVVAAMKLGMKIAGADVSQEEALEALGEVTVTDGMPEILREAAGETAVLLENNGVLPFKKGSKVSLFGRVQNDWFFTGYGSGGDVKKPYGVNLIDGLKNCEDLVLNTKLADIYEKWCKENPVDHGVWGHWPRFYPEMPLTAEIVKEAKAESDNAVFVIGRSSGEDRENALEKGSFYVTDEERMALHRICEQFDNVTLLLNIGSVMDMSWLREFGKKIGAVMIVWQGGMESGTALADVLTGAVTPCGALTATIAKQYSDYPSSKFFGGKRYNNYVEDIYVGYRDYATRKVEVAYPFGFGLTYSQFEMSDMKVEESRDGFKVSCVVKNVGNFPAKQVVQLYSTELAPEVDRPAIELRGYKKTPLLKGGEEVVVEIAISHSDLMTYNEKASAWKLTKGDYRLSLGFDSQTLPLHKQISITKEVLQPISTLMAPADGKVFIE